MTILADYSQFARDVSRYLSLAKRQQQPVSLLVLAIPLTVTLPISALMRRLAQALRYQVRQEDLVGCWEDRWIGITLYGSSRSNAQQRLYDLVQQDEWWQATDQALGIDPHIPIGRGLAIFPEDGDDFLTLLHTAQQQCL